MLSSKRVRGGPGLCPGVWGLFDPHRSRGEHPAFRPSRKIIQEQFLDFICTGHALRSSGGALVSGAQGA